MRLNLLDALVALHNRVKVIVGLDFPFRAQVFVAGIIVLILLVSFRNFLWHFSNSSHTHSLLLTASSAALRRGPLIGRAPLG